MKGMRKRPHPVGLAVGVGVGVLILFGSPGARGAAAQNGKVRTMRVPNGGIQPQVMSGAKGAVHMLYYKGDPKNGDIYYLHSQDGGARFSTPIRVNSQPGSAVALGNMRGPRLACGKNGRIHVAWNGSAQARPRGPRNPEMKKDSPYNGLPMLYARLNDAGAAFEPQRNLMTRTYGLDGGGSVAADGSGNVYVVWHAAAPGSRKGEAGRTVWVARSSDEGRSFAPEAPAVRKPLGACGCCGLDSYADRKGNLYVLYRTAKAKVNRDTYLLISRNKGASFQGAPIHAWKVGACVGSNADFAEGPAGVLAAWETKGQVLFTRITPTSFRLSPPVSAPGNGKRRKYPVLAANAAGETILAWTEGMGWNRGGDLAWQVYDKNGRPTPEKGRVQGVPANSIVAAFARPDGGFSVVY